MWKRKENSAEIPGTIIGMLDPQQPCARYLSTMHRGSSVRKLSRVKIPKRKENLVEILQCLIRHTGTNMRTEKSPIENGPSRGLLSDKSLIAFLRSCSERRGLPGTLAQASRKHPDAICHRQANDDHVNDQAQEYVMQTIRPPCLQCR